jgi:hypothetical protein
MTRPQTLADCREYLEAGMTPLACDGCGARVEVKKNSALHTSVQWSRAAVSQCAEFSARAALGERPPLTETCTTLRTSIERAVRDGRLLVHGTAAPTAEP